MMEKVYKIGFSPEVIKYYSINRSPGWNFRNVSFEEQQRRDEAQRRRWAGYSPEEKARRLRASFNSEESFKRSAESCRQSEARTELAKRGRAYWAALTKETKAQALAGSIHHPEARRLVGESIRVRQLQEHGEYSRFLRSLQQEDKEWLTLFWEGDGTVSRKYEMVTFNQKDVRMLEHVRDLLQVDYKITTYGGCSMLSVTGRGRVLALLELFASLAVSPFRVEQLQEVSDIFGFGLTPVAHKPTKHGFTGFWDAEGGSGVSSDCGYPKLIISAGQKDRGVLDRFVELWNGGGVYPSNSSVYSLNFNGDSAWEVGCWLLKTSRNSGKKDALHERMYAVQEYVSRRTRR